MKLAISLAPIVCLLTVASFSAAFQLPATTRTQQRGWIVPFSYGRVSARVPIIALKAEEEEDFDTSTPKKQEWVDPVMRANTSFVLAPWAW
mmetsp:Transcript_30421/g.69635  ORF Transcript_30421/g.69635 Transcript_30421/m.69635 type:complete len:91 (-) Transcript_30421:523-795(-)